MRPQSGVGTGGPLSPWKAGGCSGLETGSSPIANMRNLLGLSGLCPFPPSSTIHSCAQGPTRGMSWSSSLLNLNVNVDGAALLTKVTTLVRPKPDPNLVPIMCLERGQPVHTREAEELMAPESLVPPKAWMPGSLVQDAAVQTC